MRANGAESWSVIARLEALTGILAGPDGAQSRGIYCTRCRFGFRRDFGGYPVVEGRTSLANDFNDEVHRRECAHWSSYLDHPEAFFYCGEDGGRAVPAPPSPPRDSARRCECCERLLSVSFRCVETQLCFLCLASVARLTGGYDGLQTLIVEENPDEFPRRRSRRGRKRCKNCRASGSLITVAGVGYCRPCGTAQVEKILGV